MPIQTIWLAQNSLKSHLLSGNENGVMEGVTLSDDGQRNYSKMDSISLVEYAI